MNLEKIYELGKDIGILKLLVSGNLTVKSPFFENMSDLLNRLKLDLKRILTNEEALAIFNQLLNNFSDIAKLVLLEQEEQKKQGNKKKIDNINKEIVEKFENLKPILIKEITIWEDRIQNALTKINVVRLSTDTKLNPQKLSEGAKSFFNTEIWNKTTELEKADLEDACRCISLQAWTPSAMITMRVVESALRSYYKKITSNDPLKKLWSELIQELNTFSSANKKLLGYFDYLKEIRNRVEHPEARFSQFEAEDVFNHAIYIFNTIYA